MTTQRKVLVCEDDPIQLSILSTALERSGYAPVVARNAREARLRIQQRGGVDAVVADVQLGDGNAFDLVNDLRRIGFDAPTIMMSAYANAEMRSHALGIGARAFLEKPCRLSEVVDRVGKVVRENRSRLGRERVLVVESNLRLGTVVKETLTAEGMEACLVGSAEAAREALRSADKPFDALCVDMHLPGKAGGELIAEVRNLDPGAYVIMTADPSKREAILAGYAAGADNLVHRPFSPTRLAAVVRKFRPQAKAMRERAERIAARRRRLESRPRFVRFLLKLRDDFRARKGSKRRERAVLVTAGTVALLAGMIVFQAAAWVDQAVERERQREQETLRRITDAMKMGSGEGVQPEWYLNSKLSLDRRTQEDRRRYFRDHLAEMRLNRFATGSRSLPGVFDELGGPSTGAAGR